jgi:hypothetical protein
VNNTTDNTKNEEICISDINTIKFVKKLIDAKKIIWIKGYMEKQDNTLREGRIPNITEKDGGMRKMKSRRMKTKSRRTKSRRMKSRRRRN